MMAIMAIEARVTSQFRRNTPATSEAGRRKDFSWMRTLAMMTGRFVNSKMMSATAEAARNASPTRMTVLEDASTLTLTIDGGISCAATTNDDVTTAMKSD